MLPLLCSLLPLLCAFAFQLGGARGNSLKSVPDRSPLAFHQYMVNLGEVPSQRSHAATFWFTNRGAEPIELRRLETSCGCLTQNVRQKVVQPGEAGNFDLWIQSASQTSGAKQYTCQAVYGPVDSPEVEYRSDLVFRITLPEHSVSVSPRALIFHQPNSQVTEHFVDVTDLRGRKLNVLDVRTESPLASVELLRLRDLPVKDREEGVVGRLKVSVGAVPQGTHNAVVEILTDDAEFDRLQLPLRIFGPQASVDSE